LFNDLKEKDKDKKLSKDKFIGFMKLLITAITSDQSVKNTVISKKINDESLFEIIYSKVLSEDDYTKEMRQNFDDNQEIAKLFLSIEGENIDSKFIKMENLNDIILNINIKNKNRNEESTSQEVFDIYNDFIIKCLTGSADPEIISKLLKFITSKKKKSFYHQNNVKKQKCPRICNHVGLKNIGCICYVNSILQQMYMVPSFRYAIMSSDDQKPLNYQTSFFNNNRFDDNLLHQLQKTYTYLTYSEKQAYNPKDFCASFKDFDGAPINPMIQQDSQEFFNNLCDKIENSLKSTKYRYIIDNIFTGKTCSSVICEECNTISNRLENFYNLTLEVKNIKNLYESLQKLISPEKIDQFNCEVCKKKVTITKRNSLAKLPNVLFVHLKRFYMNYESEQTEKINSKFEFPNTLNLKNYCVEEISKNNAKGNETDVIYPKEEEYYEYELKGINVHIGNAMGGHYISFIDVERDGHDNELNIKSSIENGIIKSKWLKFNDSIITEFDPKDIPIESYGGSLEENVSNENIQNA
jgi:ubiquitin carboxyl-terminal hydrolase 34